MSASISQRHSFYGQEYDLNLSISLIKSDKTGEFSLLHPVLLLSVFNGDEKICFLESVFKHNSEALRHFYVKEVSTGSFDFTSANDDMKGWLKINTLFNQWASKINQLSEDNVWNLLKKVKQNEAKYLELLVEDIERTL